MVRKNYQRRAVLKSLFAAAVLPVTLSGCGGGGGGDTVADAPPPGPAPSPSPAPAPAVSRFFASWTASPVDVTSTLPGLTPGAPRVFNNQTVRQVLRLSLAGDTLRVRISNLFGTASVTFSGVRVARSTGQSSIDSSTDRAVTFSGQASVTLAAGAELLSDAVALPVSTFDNIAISMFFATLTSMPTVHPVARQTGFSGFGNQLSAVSIQGNVDPDAPYFGLTAVETSSTETTKVVVAFGDSLTDGSGSSLDTAKRYPNQLDGRLKAAGFRRTGVVNAGIGGNRWLHDVAGTAGSTRFERDVLGVAGVTHTIILLGINDIGFSVETPSAGQEVSAQQIISAITAAAASAKARGIKVFLGTLTPYKGAGYFSDAGEVKRQAVNAAIRSNSLGADGVFDFEAATRSPVDPTVLNPAFDAGDHLHLNDAGYAAMAAAIDLTALQ
jgi:lysophospholipase L1-like esterase